MNISSITSTASVALADKARLLELEGKKILKLQTGDPDFDTHPLVIEAAYRAMKAGQTHYSFAQGLPELRDLISRDLNNETGGSLTRNEILITQGAAEGIHALLAAIIEYNDEIIILEPNWPTVDSLVTINGGKPVKISFLDEDRLLENLDRAFTIKTKAICFNTPNNPTGCTLSQTIIGAITTWAIAKGLYIIADEVYRYLQYENFSTSLNVINEYDKYIFVDSFSKKYAMTGWRIGYIAAQASTINLIGKASQLVITHVNVPAQYGAIEAISRIEVKQYCNSMRDQYNNRRIIIKNFCNHENIEHLRSDGAFYFFIKLNRGTDDLRFANEFLMENNVCVVPGSAYGKSGKGYFRITYAVPVENVLKALSYKELI